MKLEAKQRLAATKSSLDIAQMEIRDDPQMSEDEVRDIGHRQHLSSQEMETLIQIHKDHGSKSRVHADSTYDGDPMPVSNMGGGYTAGVDEASHSLLERQLQAAEEGEQEADDPQVKKAYSRLANELKRALGDPVDVEAAQGDGPPADCMANDMLICNDTSDQMSLTTDDPAAHTELGLGPEQHVDDEITCSTEDPTSGGEAFDMLIDGEPEDEEPLVQQLTYNDGGTEPDPDQPLLIDDLPSGIPTV